MAGDCALGWHAGRQAADWILDESDSNLGLAISFTPVRLRDAWRDAAFQFGDSDALVYMQDMEEDLADRWGLGVR